MLVDREDDAKKKVSGKTDTFKSTVLQFEGGRPEGSLMKRYFKVRVSKATMKTLSGTVLGETTVADFARESGGAPSC